MKKKKFSKRFKKECAMALFGGTELDYDLFVAKERTHAKLNKIKELSQKDYENFIISLYRDVILKPKEGYNMATGATWSDLFYIKKDLRK